MKTILALALCLLTTSGFSQGMWRNFATTNPAPVIETVAGSNAVSLFTTPDSQTRRYTVSSKTDTNVVNILAASQAQIATNGNFRYPAAGTNASALTNGSVVTISGKTDTNVVTIIAASEAQKATNGISSAAVAAGTNGVVVLTNSPLYTVSLAAATNMSLVSQTNSTGYSYMSTNTIYETNTTGGGSTRLYGDSYLGTNVATGGKVLMTNGTITASGVVTGSSFSSTGNYTGNRADVNGIHFAAAFNGGGYISSTVLGFYDSSDGSSITKHIYGGNTASNPAFRFTMASPPSFRVGDSLGGTNCNFDIAGALTVSGLTTSTNGFFYPQATNTAPTAANIGGTVGSVTNHLMKNVGGALIDYWSDGTTLYSKVLAP